MSCCLSFYLCYCSPVFHDLRNFEGQLFCRISFNMGLSGVFLWLGLFFGKNTGNWCCALLSPSYQGVWWGNIITNKIFSQSRNPLWCEFYVFSPLFFRLLVHCHSICKSSLYIKAISFLWLYIANIFSYLAVFWLSLWCFFGHEKWFFIFM